MVVQGQPKSKNPSKLALKEVTSFLNMGFLTLRFYFTKCPEHFDEASARMRFKVRAYL